MVRVCAGNWKLVDFPADKNWSNSKGQIKEKEVYG